MTEAIRAEGLIKNFGSTKALAGADLAAETGTVLGVLGPNRGRQDNCGSHPDYVAVA